MCTIRISGPRARANWGIGPHGSHTRRTPHPTRQAHGRHGPRGRSPESRGSRQARPPKTAPPCRYNFSLLGDGVRRRPTLPVPRCDTGHPAQRAQGARTRLQGATRHIIFDPAGPRLKPNSSPARSLRDARTTITHSGHTFTLGSALSSETSLTPSRDSITRTQLIHSASHTHSQRIHSLSLTHSNASTHSLTRIHSLTTHSHSLEVRVDAHLTGSH
jgi:hypothetical protein